MRRGEMGRAEEDYARAESLWRAHGPRMHRLLAVGSLGGIAYQQGDLARAQAWNESLLREWLGLGRWAESVTAAVNLCLILLDRGRLGLPCV